MSRGGFKITQVGYQHEAPEVVDSSVPSWMKEFASKAESIVVQEESKKAVTVVDKVRDRQNSIYEQIYSIMNGKKPLYSSVEEAVSDYQSKTGLNDYLNKIQSESAKKEAAKQILASVDEKKTQNDETPVIFTNIPASKTYVDNVVNSNPGISIPAVLHMVGEFFDSDGVSISELDDPKLQKYVSDKIVERTPTYSENSTNIGRNDVGSSSDFGDNDPFEILRPSNSYS